MSCTGCEVSTKKFDQFSESELFSFLRNHNVIRKDRICPKCGAQCTFQSRGDTMFFFRCRARHMRQQGKQKRVSVQCSFQESVRKNTFFEGTTLTIPKICSFVSWDCLRLKSETKCLMEEHSLSRQTVIDFKSFLREVYIDWSLSNSRQQIGGPGKIVEIDEAKVGKRKYNCGRVVQGQWVFGGIERESGDFFILPVEHRDTATLLAIIQERVADGSTIMSDCWKAYNCLAEEGFVHQTVNHSKNFVDPETRAHTQNIERLWRDMRDHIPRFGRKKYHFIGYLAKFQFQKKFKSHGDRVHELFMAIGRLYDPYKEAIINEDAHAILVRCL
ncbi:hypothetical protein ACLKA6_002977 [Drosophila palustris]